MVWGEYKMARTTVSNKIKLILGITSPDARWGIFAILFAVPFSLWAFAFSFYCIYKWGGVMNPTIWLNLAVAFGVLGFVILIISILLGVYWKKHPREDVIGEKLDVIFTKLERLDSIEKMLRRDRNERKQSGK